MLFKYDVNQKREKKNTSVNVVPPELPPRNDDDNSEEDEFVNGSKIMTHKRSNSRNNRTQMYQV